MSVYSSNNAAMKSEQSRVKQACMQARATSYAEYLVQCICTRKMFPKFEFVRAELATLMQALIASPWFADGMRKGGDADRMIEVGILDDTLVDGRLTRLLQALVQYMLACSEGRITRNAPVSFESFARVRLCYFCATC